MYFDIASQNNMTMKKLQLCFLFAQKFIAKKNTNTANELKLNNNSITAPSMIFLIDIYVITKPC